MIGHGRRAQGALIIAEGSEGPDQDAEGRLQSLGEAISQSLAGQWSSSSGPTTWEATGLYGERQNAKGNGLAGASRSLYAGMNSDGRLQSERKNPLGEMIDVGDKLPAFALRALEGDLERVPYADAGPSLLILLRHLG